jgi:hypothetical protein
MRGVLAPLSGEVLGFSNIKPVQGPSPGGFLIFTFRRTATAVGRWVVGGADKGAAM